MRAIMQFEISRNGNHAPAEGAKVDRKLTEIIDDVVHHCGWTLRIDDKAVIAAKTKEILSSVSPDDRQLVAKTLLRTIYDPRTKTWGIINAPSESVIEFRLKNHVSDNLKRACNLLIEDLRGYQSDAKDKAVEFKARSAIEVLEPGSQHQAFFGEVIQSKPWLLARTERRPSHVMAQIATIVAIACVLLTSPLPALVLGATYGHDAGGPWLKWLLASLMHFTPAFLVAAAVSWLDVYLHWRGIKREAPIRWRVGKETQETRITI